MKRISYPISPGTCTALKRCIYTIVRIGTDSQVSTGTSFILCLGSEGKTDLLKVDVCLQHYLNIPSWKMSTDKLRKDCLLFWKVSLFKRIVWLSWGRKRSSPDRIWYYKSFTWDKILISIMEKSPHRFIIPVNASWHSVFIAPAVKVYRSFLKVMPLNLGVSDYSLYWYYSF